MPGFLVGSSQPDRFADLSAGAPAAPVPFWSAVQAGYDSATQVHNLGAREEQWRDALWSRDKDIEGRTGVKLPLSMTVANGMSQASAGVGTDLGTLQRAGLQFQGDDEHEAAIDALRQKYPQQMAGVPTVAQLKGQVGQRMDAVEQAAGTAGAQHPIGSFLGGAAGGLFDPGNAALLGAGGLGGELPSLGEVGLRTLAGAVLKRAAVQGGLQAGAAALEAPLKMVEARTYGGPAYGVGDAAQDVAQDFVGGALAEGGLFAPLHIAGGALIDHLMGPEAARGAVNALDQAGRDSAAVGPLRAGADYDAGLASLQADTPMPAVEPSKNLDDLFGNGPISPVQLPDVKISQDSDLGAQDLLARADYRGRPIYAASLDPRQTQAAPELFQYKGGGDAEGVTDRLQGVKAWDPLSSGKALFWQDPEGQTFVADGHQRRGLALRLEQQGFEPKMDGYLLRSQDGWSAPEVRTLAALKNIREGAGTPIDAAKVFRDSPGLLNDDSLPVSGDFIAQAKGLARLSPDAFGAAVNGVLPERYAAAIGEMAADRPDLHGDLVSLLKAGDPANLDEARAMIQEGKLDDWLKTQPDQQDLFGAVPRQSVVIARAKVNAAVLGALKRDLRLFGGVVRNADALEAGGNTLARTANEAELATSSAALEVLQKLGARHGPIGEAMTEAAKAVLGGARPSDAAKGLVERVKAAVASGERLGELRETAIDPKPAPATEVVALKRFDEPGGEGQKSQIPPKPEMAESERALTPVQGEVLGAGDLWRMPPEQLQAMLDEKTESNFAKLVRAFGSEEEAKTFERLQRASNSFDTARADRASAEFDARYGNLTPEQERLVYGIGENDAQADEIKTVLQAHEDVHLQTEHGDGDDDQWLAYQAAVGAREATVDELKAVPEGRGSPEAQAAFVRLKKAAAGLAERGVDGNDIPRRMAEALVDRGGWHPEQAAEIIGQFVRDVTEGREAPEAPKPKALVNPLFADLEPIGAYREALDRLRPCAPGE